MSLTSTRKSRGPTIVCEENIFESTMEHRMRFAPSQLLAVKLQALQLLAQQLLRPQRSALFRFLRATYQRDWSCPRPSQASFDIQVPAFSGSPLYHASERQGNYAMYPVANGRCEVFDFPSKTALRMRQNVKPS